MRQIIQQCCCRTVFDLVSIRTAFSFAKRPWDKMHFLRSSLSQRLRVSAVKSLLFPISVISVNQWWFFDFLIRAHPR
jgi:hypothetical protein